MKRLVLYFCILVFSNLFAQNYEWVRTGKFKSIHYPGVSIMGIDLDRNQYYFVNSPDSLVYENTMLGDSCTLAYSSSINNTGILSLAPDGSFRWFKKKTCTLSSSFFLNGEVEGNGNLYLVGNFEGDFYFDGVYYATSTDSISDFVMKLDEMGNVLAFEKIESLAPPVNYHPINISTLAINTYGNQVHILINAHNDFKVKDYVVDVPDNHYASYLIALDKQNFTGLWASPVLDSTEYYMNDLEYSLQGDIITAVSKTGNTSYSSQDTIYVKKYDKNTGSLLWETKLRAHENGVSWSLACDKYNHVYVSASSLWLSNSYEPRLYQLNLSDGSVEWFKDYPVLGAIENLAVSPATNHVYFDLYYYVNGGLPIEYSLHGLDQNANTIFYAQDTALNIHKGLNTGGRIQHKMDHCGDFYMVAKFDTIFTLMDNTVVPQNYNGFWPQVQYYFKDFLIAKFPVENLCGSTVSLEEIQEESLLLYPNPTENSLHISHSATEAEIEIWDSFGHRVLAKNIKQEEEIETESLSAGIYILKLHSDRGNSMQKFVKK